MTATASGEQDRAALWLALAPSWTGEAALAARFPLGDADEEEPDGDTFYARLSIVVGRWAEQGLAERNGTLKPDQIWLTEFWHTTAHRRQELEAAAATLGRPALAAQARTIAGRLDGLDLDLPLDPVMKHWIALATADPDGYPERRFLADVRDWCRSGHGSQAREYITAAEIFEPVAGGDFPDAVESARRLLRLANRREHDRHALLDYQPRPEWSGAMQELLLGRGPEWAMHLVGAGGTGKTSFVRYVASGEFVAQADLPPIMVGRVDFDHLSPAFPAQRPEHLLNEFADELVAEIRTGAAEAARARFYRYARAADAADAADGPARELATSEALAAFVDFLGELPGRCLLVLDTCEELSRVDPAGAPDVAVLATFDLLAEVHRGRPDVRVLLCGRRRMTPGTTVPMRTVRARGFRRGEAVRYLTRPDGDDTMPEPLVEAILELSPERGAAERGHRRFSPFDVRLYRHWWMSEKDITAEQLRHSGRSAYVQQRIVDRLEQWSVAALPAVALLGRFDRLMLESVLPGNAHIDAVLAEYARQDWIDTHTDPASQAQILEVNPSMRPLLLRWAKAQGEARLEADRRRLAAALGEQLRSVPLDQISTANVISAVTLAPPDTAALLWEQLEGRMRRPADWWWMGRVCSRVRGALAEAQAVVPPRRQVPPDDLLVAAVRATVVGVSMRSGALIERTAEWAAVLELTGGRTEPIAQRLRLRAELGRLTATARDALRTADAAERAAALIRSAAEHPELDGSVVGLLEATADEAPPGPALDSIAAAADHWLYLRGEQATGTTVRIAVHRLAHGRAPLPATRELDRIARSAPIGEDRWPDWLAPPSSVLRLDLYLAVCAYLTGRSLQALPLRQWERDAEAEPASIDADRLLSVCLQLRLGHGTVAHDHLDRLRPACETAGRRASRLRLHRLTPPLWQSLSDGYLMLGDAETAQRLLEDGHRRARAAGDDQTARTARAGLHRLGRRLRRTLAVESISAEDYVDGDWAGRALIDGTPPPPGTPASLADWHRRWQALSVDPRTATVAVPRLPSPAVEPVDPRLRTLLLADLREAAIAGADADVPGMRAMLLALPTQEPAEEVADENVLIVLREALAGASPEELDRFRDSHPALPPLHVAMAALELGEQRALRDPSGAKPLFGLATRLSESRSPVLALQAATLAALAHVHAGADLSDLTTRSVVLGLNTAYAAMRDHLGGSLPAWAALTDSPAERDHAWAGWLTRVRVAINGLAGRAEGRPRPPACRSVEVHPARFGEEYPAPPELDGVKDALPRLDVSAHLRLSVVAVATRLQRSPRLTVRVRLRPRELVFTAGAIPQRWLGAEVRTGWPLPAIRPQGTVRMGRGDTVPDLSEPLGATAGRTARRPPVWRLSVLPADQVRFWEAEITERLGVPGDAPMPRWYRTWPQPSAFSPAGDRPSLVRVLDGRIGRSRSEFRFVEAGSDRSLAASDIARIPASLIVLQTGNAAEDEDPDGVRDIDALSLAVRCMAAGVENLLFLPRPSPSVADAVAARAEELIGRGGRPGAMDLLALADCARHGREPNKGHVVLFLREEPDDGIG